MPEKQHGGCRVITEVMSSCHHGHHDECVHLVEDVVDDGLLTPHPENVLRVCTCDCHAGCPAAAAANEPTVTNPDALKDSCTCWDTRHSREGAREVDEPTAAADDDGPMVELNKNFSISRGCVIAAPILVLACIAGLASVYASHGTVRSVLSIPTLALFVVTVPLVLLLLAGFVPSLFHRDRQGNGVGFMIATLVAIGIGVAVGFGVVVVGPSDFASSVLLAIFAFTIYTGRGARPLPARVRHHMAAFVLLSAIVSAATGIGLARLERRSGRSAASSESAIRTETALAPCDGQREPNHPDDANAPGRGTIDACGQSPRPRITTTAVGRRKRARVGPVLRLGSGRREAEPRD